MTTKMIALAAALTLAVGLPTLAGPKGVKGSKHEVKLGHKLAALNLTDDQKTKLAPIAAAAREKVKALRADTTLTADAKKLKMREIRTEEMKQATPILTSAQKAQIAAKAKHAKTKPGTTKPAL